MPGRPSRFGGLEFDGYGNFRPVEPDQPVTLRERVGQVFGVLYALVVCAAFVAFVWWTTLIDEPAGSCAGDSGNFEARPPSQECLDEARFAPELDLEP